MILTTTPTVENHTIIEYKGIVFGEIVSGANFIRDFFASITDFLGGRSKTYENKIATSRREALQELAQEARKIGANAVVGISFEYQTMGQKDMFIVVATGTAVTIS